MFLDVKKRGTTNSTQNYIGTFKMELVRNVLGCYCTENCVTVSDSTATRYKAVNNEMVKYKKDEVEISCENKNPVDQPITIYSNNAVPKIMEQVVLRKI